MSGTSWWKPDLFNKMSQMDGCQFWFGSPPDITEVFPVMDRFYLGPKMKKVTKCDIIPEDILPQGV